MVLIAVVGIILYCDFQNIASAAPEQVNFNPVTIRNGAKIHVNGDKTLTAIDSGNKLVADNTNGTAVKGNQIEVELNLFAANNYGDDALFTSSDANNPASLSEAELNAFRQYLPAVDNDYWLSDIGTRGSISWQGYANSDNSLNNNFLQVTGKIDDFEYDETEIVAGSYAFNSDAMPENYTASKGGLWGLNYKQTADFSVYYVDKQWFSNGTIVYNNPFCKSSGVDPDGNLYKSSLIQGLVPGSGAKAFAYVSGGNRILQVQQGQILRAGTVVAFGFMKVHHEISDPTGFLIPSIYYGSGSWASPSYIGFIKLNTDITVTSARGEVQALYGLMKYYPKDTDVTAVPIKSAEKSVRPSFSLNGKAGFIRPASGNTMLSVSSDFGDVPSSSASNKEDIKLVVKSADTTITNSLAESKLSTEKSANNHAVTRYTNGVIQVPYGTKTLTIDASALNTNNANYISALANVNGTQKYAVLGQTGENLEIDLASIANNNQVGSRATVSFYAEQASPANTSDVISETPVTVEIEVVEGSEQTIRYDLGGGSGTLPSNATVKAGKSYTMADSSGLNKDGNPFSRWELTYTPYGETEEVTRLIKASEAFVIPDTSNGVIKATAMYSGLNSAKSTDSKPSVVTVTWDSNAPVGATATFADSTGTYNNDRSIRYDKIKIAGSSVSVPGAPTLSVTTKVFDGWYDAKEGGNKVTVSVTPSVNTTYYAHWLDGYKVTYDASGGTGATVTGAFSDSSTADEELVMPGGTTVGPSKGTPVANNSLYMFYGWYTQPNGGGTEISTGTSFDTLGGSKSVYAYYGLANTFLAPATSTVTANPRNISGDKYSLAQVKAAATDIASKGISSSYYSQYTSWMNADSYHLYTLLNGQSPDLANSWLECRIIHVGQHDSDGTGITFQSIHALPNKVAYDPTYSGSGYYLGNWSTSTLRTYLNSTFKATLPISLSSTLATASKLSNQKAGSYPVAKNDAIITSDQLWILSYTELVKNAGSKYSTYWGTGSDAHDGSTYAFWDSKDLVVNSKPSADSDQARLLLALNSDRSGTLIPYYPGESGISWLRSVSPRYSSMAQTFYSEGTIFYQSAGGYPTEERCVAPSFAL